MTQTLIDLFNQLFGQYQPIQEIASTDGVNITYQYCIDWGIIANYALVIILFFTVCKCISLIFVNMSRGIKL